MTTLSNNLKHLRTKNSLSQDDVAKKLFLTHQTISNHETGKSEPTVEIIKKYANLYNVNFHDLINLNLSNEANKAKKIFDSVIFDKRDKTMVILDGTKGTYDYRDIVECKILNEIASFKGKSEPFTQTVIHGGFTGIIARPYYYTGLKVALKDGSILAIYVSKEKVLHGTDRDKQDYKKAEEIKHFIDTAIKKYQS